MDAYNSSESLEDLKVVADLMSPFYSKKNYNQSPFYNAVQAGNVKFIKLFIDFKFIHLGERDHNGNTSMHHACASGLMDVVELFVKEFGIYGTKPDVHVDIANPEFRIPDDDLSDFDDNLDSLPDLDDDPDDNHEFLVPC